MMTPRAESPIASCSAAAPERRAPRGRQQRRAGRSPSGLPPPSPERSRDDGSRSPGGSCLADHAGGLASVWRSPLMRQLRLLPSAAAWRRQCNCHRQHWQQRRQPWMDVVALDRFRRRCGWSDGRKRPPCGSCVTRTTVIPSALSCWNIRRISTLVCESRLPVGSSASSSAGLLTNARPMATRCCCPPDICDGSWSTRSASPTRSNSICASRRLPPPDWRAGNSPAAS